MIDALHAVLLALLMAAGAAPAEKRLQYLFVPHAEALKTGVQPIRFTAIVRGRDVVFVVALRGGKWLRYHAVSDPASCTTHEQYALFGRDQAPASLDVDSPLDDCPSPPKPAATPAVDPELAAMLRGPVAQIAGLNPFAKLLCGRAATFGCTPSATTPYVAKKMTVDCGFDAAHGQPCER